MKALLYLALLAGLCVALWHFLDARSPVVGAKDGAAEAKIIDAADLAQAYTDNPQLAGRVFSPGPGKSAVQITGRVIRTSNGEALLTNEDAKVHVYVRLGTEKADAGDLIDGTVTKLTYLAATRSVQCDCDNVKISRYADAVPPRAGGKPEQFRVPEAPRVEFEESPLESKKR